MKMPASDKCAPMPAYLDSSAFYILEVSGGKVSEGRLYCDDANCKRCEYILTNNKLDSCVDGDAGESTRLSENDETCVGGESAKASDVWILNYTPFEQSQESCNKEAAVTIDLLRLGPADGKCHSYFWQNSTQYGYVVAAGDKYNISYNCDIGCLTSCDYSNATYTLGYCVNDQLPYSLSLVLGSEVKSCGGAAPSGKGKSKKGKAGAVAGATIGAILGIALIGFVYFRFIRRRTSEYTPIS